MQYTICNTGKVLFYAGLYKEIILKGLERGEYVINDQMDMSTVISQSKAEAFEKEKPYFPSTLTSVSPHCGCLYANKCFFGSLAYALQGK